MFHDSVIYFPYIRLPESAWLTRHLLYWDTVSTIVPLHFLDAPFLLGEHTRSLVEHELVRQIIPGQFIYELPKFQESFCTYLDSLGPRLERRRTEFRLGLTEPVHVEKLEHLGRALQEIGLASPADWEWFNVESETAMDFMTYLATCLGKLPQVSADPITDVKSSLGRFVATGESSSAIDSLRIDVLSRVFPTPMRPVTADELRRFKDAHRDDLVEFRSFVERELIATADTHEPSLRDRRLELLSREAQLASERIRARLQESGLGEAVLGKLCSVIAALPGADSCFGLVSAIYNAVGAQRMEVARSPLAYAAYVEHEFSVDPPPGMTPDEENQWRQQRFRQ